MNKKKALVMLSGGLDSALALALMLEQNIEVEAVNIKLPFCSECESHKSNDTCPTKCGDYAYMVSSLLKVKHTTISGGDGYWDIILNPKYGYGSNMNPCIDCRIFMLNKAKEYMKTSGADFIVTGEVINQRPMSQHLPALKIIEKETNLEGFIVRPLSAKFLDATIPEKEGWIDRTKMLDIKGRSRKIQIALAKEKGVTYYSSPAGGCLLTDENFSNRLRDFIKFCSSKIESKDIKLLKIGRHFRLSDDTKLIVGRNKAENEKLEKFHQNNSVKLEALGVTGPVALLISRSPDEHIKLSSVIVARFSDALLNEPVKIKCLFESGKEILVDIIKENLEEKMLVSLRV